MADKAKVKGSKRVSPPNRDHWKNFSEAIQDALDKADPEWGRATTEVTVTLEATVETRSPGNIHEYKAILTPK